LAELEEIYTRAPLQARAVVMAVDALVASPFPGMYRGIETRPGEHVMSVRPHAVFYMVKGDTLAVLAVEDSRRRVEPW